MIPNEIRKPNAKRLREIKVDYLKGKYQYKKLYSGLTEKKAKIYYAGPVEPMEPVFSKCLSLLRAFMDDESRLSNQSRYQLRTLENMMKDPIGNFTKKGLTHIIIFEYVY